MSKKPENKDELYIQELLKNSGVESMLYLNKLIGKIKKHFIESTLDAEFIEADLLTIADGTLKHHSQKLSSLIFSYLMK